MINNANPFLGAYKMPKKKQMTGMGFGGGQSEPFFSSEEVIGNPDAQNTAQRSKSTASSLKTAYDAVSQGSDLIPNEKNFGPLAGTQIAQIYERTFQNPEGASAKDKDYINRNLSEYMEYGKQFAQTARGKKLLQEKEFSDFASGKPRDLMPWTPGKVENYGGQKQSSSTGNVAGWSELDSSGKRFERRLNWQEEEQRAKAGTLAGLGSSTYDDLRASLGLNIPNQSRRY